MGLGLGIPVVELDGFGVTVTGSHFPKAGDWSCDRVLLNHGLNFLFGGVGLSGILDEDAGLVLPKRSDAKVGRGDKFGVAKSRNDDLEECGGSMGGTQGGTDKGIDMPALWGPGS